MRVRAILAAATILIFSFAAYAQTARAERTSVSAALASRSVGGPSWAEAGKLTSSDGEAFDYLGTSVAITGNNIVAGGPSRAAYIFVKPDSGWANTTQTAELLPRGKNRLASTVAMNDRTALVSAEGLAYVYVEPVGGWRNVTERAEVGEVNSLSALAVNGSTSAFGGGGDGNYYFWVVVEPEGGWEKRIYQPSANLILPGVSGSPFSLAISGDTIVAGSPGNYGEGTVYVYVEPTGGWTGNISPTATLIASNGNVDDRLGFSVAIYGNTIVAGAPGVNQQRGAVYVFQEPAGGWQDMFETAELQAPDSIELGLSVGVAGDGILGGAPYTTVGFNQAQGAAYLYAKPKGGWKNTSTFTAELTAPDGAPGDEFGISVGLIGATAVVGAPDATVGSNLYQGAAYVFVK
jgi:hypothetical protein